MRKFLYVSWSHFILHQEKAWQYELAAYLVRNCRRAPYFSRKGSWSQDVVSYVLTKSATYIFMFRLAHSDWWENWSRYWYEDTFLLLFLLGQDDYDRLRPLSYQEANLVLVCFDVTNPTSFENVAIKVIAATVHWHGAMQVQRNKSATVELEFRVSSSVQCLVW